MSATPKWAVHHADGSWSCVDCGRASRSLDGVRGHRRACPGISGVVAQVDRIRAAAAPVQPVISQMSGSHNAAQPAPGAARSQPTWAPLPFRAGMLGVKVSQPKLDQSLEIAALKQEVFRLRDAVRELGEVAANDIRHLSEAQAQAQATAAPSNPLPWIIGIGLAAIVTFALISDSTDADQGVVMGSRESKDNGGMLSKLGQRIGSRVIDKALGKALSVVF